MTEYMETIIVGGGQAGLCVSYYLTQQRREHIVLEQSSKAGEAWRNHRWDSFTFVTPNWSILMPGAEYNGGHPDGYMPRDEIIAYFEEYVERYKLPLRYGARVMEIEKSERGYTVRTDSGTLEAAHVVIATGSFQTPKLPAFSVDLPPEIQQFHSSEYRNPNALKPGAVLVVGSAQSGCQIAEELYQSGRKVYLCVGSTGRAPRHYRGKDIIRWLYETGFFDRTVDKLPSPKAKYGSNPQGTGKDGGHNINLHQFVRDGVSLLGHIRGVQGNKITLAPDLKESLAKSDKFEADLLKMIDEYIEKNNIGTPKETPPILRDGYEVEEILELDLVSAGITSVIWATGYKFDFSLVKLPIFDEDGYPVQQRGVTGYPGLYFVGLHWLYKTKSTLLMGVGEDAAFIASQITAG